MPLSKKTERHRRGSEMGDKMSIGLERLPYEKRLKMLRQFNLERRLLRRGIMKALKINGSEKIFGTAIPLLSCNTTRECSLKLKAASLIQRKTNIFGTIHT